MTKLSFIDKYVTFSNFTNGCANISNIVHKYKHNQK